MIPFKTYQLGIKSNLSRINKQINNGSENTTTTHHAHSKEMNKKNTHEK